MKKVLSGLVLASTFVLTACGGGSSDSSAPTNTNNGNNPVTNPQPNPADPNTSRSPACEVKGTNVYVKEGSSCSYSNPAKGADLSSITCHFDDKERKEYVLTFEGQLGNVYPYNQYDAYPFHGLIDEPTEIFGISYICK